jgi:hypothetical protein
MGDENEGQTSFFSTKNKSSLSILKCAENRLDISPVKIWIPLAPRSNWIFSR